MIVFSLLIVISPKGFTLTCCPCFHVAVSCSLGLWHLGAQLGRLGLSWVLQRNLVLSGLLEVLVESVWVS